MSKQLKEKGTPVSKSSIDEITKGKGIKCARCGMSKSSDDYYAARVITADSPDGHLTICKNCVGNMYKPEDPGTFMHILHALDVPWFPSIYKTTVLAAKKNRHSVATFGKYIVKTKLTQYKKYGFEDSNAWQVDNLATEDFDFIENYTYRMPVEEPVLTTATPRSNFTLDLPATNNEEDAAQELATASNYVGLLTEEEREYLQIEWGIDYMDDQLLSMEKQYQQINKDFNIETAMDEDFARKICMVSLMQDEALRSSDMTLAKAAADVFSKLTKDANLQPSQNVGQEGVLNSISELVNIIEREGAIPRFIPEKDDIDLADITIKDLKSFTRDLINNDESIQSRHDEMVAAMDKVGEEEIKARIISGNEALDPQGNIMEADSEKNLLNDVLYEGLDGLTKSEKEKLMKDAKKQNRFRED